MKTLNSNSKQNSVVQSTVTLTKKLWVFFSFLGRISGGLRGGLRPHQKNDQELFLVQDSGVSLAALRRSCVNWGLLESAACRQVSYLSSPSFPVRREKETDLSSLSLSTVDKQCCLGLSKPNGKHCGLRRLGQEESPSLRNLVKSIWEKILRIQNLLRVCAEGSEKQYRRLDVSLASS